MSESVSRETQVLNLPSYNFDMISNPIVNRAAYFYDEQHLNSDGANAYTLQVWDSLKTMYEKNH
ncbi:MAG: hypothetical protein A3C11_03340 [Candidatus Sungbacteria bacterium RIFCSPHIGHO2_02_FULL_49_12]|uniref:SGNH domain-containing protein n=1 Tax=Candidatus Sungbacteria bacterium RIFCSPHIGHO2_02_FULL_49_12 TaxID=1802271 RepID=A0A1G2KP27_9BACT|nr:MAG: hypothetical protein A3C11_03340 [Candidatus Sungbacteria bacterium RIFCSPHIGHO2_02_FULL_49_12]